jgi:DNA helicase II / ATP-dependent DNA helicase PcrA
MHLDKINEIISKMYNEIKNYELFDLIKEKYENYIIKQKITALKEFLKKGYYQSILSAYKLFYVGCSRARKNLIILVSKSKTKDYQL